MLTVSLSQATSQTVTVRYATAGGTATPGSDFTAVSGTLTFTPGQTVQTVAVPIVRDLVAEATETFTVGLTSPAGATLARTSAIGTILDDDTVTPPPTPSVTINNAAQTEGNSGTATLRFTVTLSAAASSPVTVIYATANGTATAGSDYTAKSGTVTFAPGQTAQIIDVTILGDTIVEPNETFLVRLTSASGATIATSQAIGTIVNDDISQPTLPTLTIAGASIAEGNSGTRNLVFTVSMSKSSTSAVTVRYATANGTATAGSDYNAASGTITFAPGTTTRTITVSVLGDTAVEANETFSVALSSPSGATIATGTASGTILNDDQPPAQAPVVLAVRDDWGAGFVADMTITNTGTTTTSGWQLEFDLDANITNIWNAEIVSRVGSRYVIRMASWNGRIAPGGKITFGFQASGSDRTVENVKLTLL